jgi:hypothetical protein
MELILKLIRKPSYNEPHIKDRKLITQKKFDYGKPASAISTTTQAGENVSKCKKKSIEVALG